jgi:hypothetical protein
MLYVGRKETMRILDFFQLLITKRLKIKSRKNIIDTYHDNMTV